MSETGFCEECGHAIEYHGADGFDVEITDHGEMDCNCTEWRPLIMHDYPVPGPVVSAGPIIDGMRMLYVKAGKSL